ncbi:MAG: thiosulfate oxidation carrier protein SoxY [Candidatus Thiodiazotropha endolucinida]
MKRRSFLKISGGCAIALTSVTGLLKPVFGYVGTHATNPFESTSEKEVLQILFGGMQATYNDDVRIEVPLQSNGIAVPVKVKCGIDGVGLIAILTKNNRYPLNSVLRLQGADAYYSIRIRVEKSSPIIAYVKAGNSVYFAATEMKFSHGGYGSHLE